jgi:hypothetical protein
MTSLCKKKNTVAKSREVKTGESNLLRNAVAQKGLFRRLLSARAADFLVFLFSVLTVLHVWLHYSFLFLNPLLFTASERFPNQD